MCAAPGARFLRGAGGGWRRGAARSGGETPRRIMDVERLQEALKGGAGACRGERGVGEPCPHAEGETGVEGGFPAQLRPACGEGAPVAAGPLRRDGDRVPRAAGRGRPAWEGRGSRGAGRGPGVPAGKGGRAPSSQPPGSLWAA